MNQELSIEANQEFRNGNIDQAYDMALASGCLVKQFSKEEWVALMDKTETRFAKELKEQQEVNRIIDLID